MISLIYSKDKIVISIYKSFLSINYLEIFGFSQIDIDSLVLKNGLGGGFSKIGDVKACVSTAAFE